MRWRLSQHARQEAIRRGLPLALLGRILDAPEQVVRVRDPLKAYQAKVGAPNGVVFVLRVIVDDTVDPMVVVTAYRTSKVAKYWRDDEDLL